MVSQDPVSDSSALRKMEWGSDALAELLKRLDFKYVTLNPGSSYRGLHDSLVNYNNNENPRMILCLHEEHAVSIAHGWAKVMEKPLLVILHANVGLQHAAMSIYNAFCDRVPVVILGAYGPWDADRRREWIDHIQITSGDQGSIIRPFVKWDDQPASIPAAMNSILRATHMASTKPFGPTYVPLDLTYQEEPLPSGTNIPEVARFAPGHRVGPSEVDVEKVKDLLMVAKYPLFMISRVDRTTKSWKIRVEFISSISATVIADGKQPAAFPFPHPNHPTPPRSFLPKDSAEIVRKADLIVVLEWTDLAGTLKAACGDGLAAPAGKIILVSEDANMANGWAKDTGCMAPTDLHIPCDPDCFFSALAKVVPPKSQWRVSGEEAPSLRWPPAATPEPIWPKLGSTQIILQSQLVTATYAAVSMYPTTIVRINLGFNPAQHRFSGPLSYLGGDGGGGIASGPGMTVGAALALREIAEQGGDRRLPLAFLGDGDFLMGNSSIWTAVSVEIPLLIIVVNNASFFNDERHQERIAVIRKRPVENKHIGVNINDPQPNLSLLAQSFGLTTPGHQIRDPAELEEKLAWAVEQVMVYNKVVLVDVRSTADAY